MRLESGQRFGDLLVEDEIGTGAFATVYRARDEIIGRHVALKVVEREGGAEGERRARAVLREARLMGALSSPYVVTLYRLHVADGRRFIAVGLADTPERIGKQRIVGVDAATGLSEAEPLVPAHEVR